jgi:hypothetical protein
VTANDCTQEHGHTQNGPEPVIKDSVQGEYHGCNERQKRLMTFVVATD